MQLRENRPEHILIVEDEGLIAADVQRRLQRLGYPLPAIASSGVEALRCAQSTAFDLVLMDIRLKGGMDGISTAQALKSEFETSIVYMTAHGDQETIDRAKVTEPLGYILKPISDGDLRSVVEISLYRAQMERRVRASEAWLATTLRSVGDGIVATDIDGQIVFMNPVAEKLTGWNGGEARGRLLMDVVALFEDSHAQPARNPISDLPTGDYRNYRLMSRTGADTQVEVRHFENRSVATAMPVPPAAAKSASAVDEPLGTIVVLRDITLRRQMEDRLVQSQRMEAIANMAGGLAHDFNNQLTVVLGYADELCAHPEDDVTSAAQAIKQAASVAASITGQLLTLSRRGSARVEVLNFNEIVCEVQPMISHSLGRSRQLVTNLAPRAGFIRGDRSQLKQILLNLALNARDAMPKGGELLIETSNLEIEPASEPARLYRPGQYVRLLVTDTGEGMDKATLARIFEPFFTTKESGFGTGLGLSITHSIISQSDGYIGATSEVGRGTTFEILLPCVGNFKKMGKIGGPRDAIDGDSTPTILLVDDDRNVRRLMHKFLEREGYQLLEAGDGQEAEVIAELYPEPIHVLVTDVMMPGMTGPELALRLTPLRPGMKTLFVSGYQHDVLERHGLSDDANLLHKPFLAPDLIQRVSMLLSQGTQVVQ